MRLRLFTQGVEGGGRGVPSVDGLVARWVVPRAGGI